MSGGLIFTDKGVTNVEKRVKRLELAVIVLSGLFIISISATLFAVAQINILSDKIPNYHEVKEDIKSAKIFYDSTSVKMDSAHVKERVINAYDKTVDNGAKLFNHLKELKDKRNDSISKN